jgi:hypothetical protein
MSPFRALCGICLGCPTEPPCALCGGTGSIPAAQLTRADRRELARKRLDVQNAQKKP